MKWSVGLIVGLAQISVYAATPDEALKSVLDDPRLKLHDQAISTVRGANFTNPISEAELRIDKGDFESDEVKFGLRLHTKGVSEYRQGKEFARIIEESERLLREERLAALLMERYLLITKAAQFKKKRELVEDLRQTVERASRALEFAARRDRSELKSALQIKGDIQSLLSTSSEIEREYENLDQELTRLGLGKLKDFRTDSLSGPETLKQRLKEVSDSRLTPLQARLATAQRERIQSSLSVDRAKSGKWLSYFQLSFAQDKSEQTYGVEVGLLFPFLSGSDPSSIDKETKALRDHADALTAEKEALSLSQSNLRELESAISLYDTLSKSQGFMSRENLKKLTQSVSRQDPFLALELEKSWLEGRMALLDLEAKVRELYVAALNSQGILSREPRINHLSLAKSQVN